MMEVRHDCRAGTRGGTGMTAAAARAEAPA